jgi:hypothetical protein
LTSAAPADREGVWISATGGLGDNFSWKGSTVFRLFYVWWHMCSFLSLRPVR